MLTQEDRELLAKKGISEEKLAEQLNDFKTGFPYLELDGAAAIDNGIMAIDEEKEKAYSKAWDAYKLGDKTIVKFVPASGAASRMFKNMFEFLGAAYNAPETDFEKKFFDRIHDFAFFDDLNAACLKNQGKDIDTLVEEGKYKPVVANLLESAGLNYGQLPKGLLPEHRSLFEKLVDEKVSSYAAKFGTEYHVSFSEQKPSTDTVAATMENEPFRTDGKLLFRPGGHGALIENLNDLDADIVFVKNIDNVVPDRLKADTVTYKKVIAGVLVTLQKKAFDYLNLLDSGKYTHAQIAEIINFLQHDLCCRNPQISLLEDAELVVYLKNKLNRPMRVAGVVKNVGEPGGGPFRAYNADGTISLQILESSQIDTDDPVKKEMFENGSHFNPVDLVCAVKDYKGNKFDLVKYVDKSTGFISYKSKNGKELKALELPGLWNGAMSDWNTVFVEVPLSTFNPVKTVNDLLRPQHQ